MRIQVQQPTRVARVACYLAWKACGGPIGMGVFQDEPEATENDVWENILSAGDYLYKSPTPSTRISADYVFGRMMKLRMDIGDTYIDVPDSTPRPDYQAWCHTYPTYASLIEAAQKIVEL